ncbi:Vta1 like-domain-containing protein [Lentinula edodes]|nr:Vta1 like-domain-containing protein [Lentinula edodes]
MSSFGLPPLPLPLKSISPYLQRAAELHQKDPVIAYWCAYYAAQVGISLKAKDNASRMLLLELLDVLEKLKREIGPNDAIDTESVSAAYVENFALRVFSVADDEDRSGNSTRSTAKKFLAAANFLEVLKTFPKTELTEATEGKIRYSKWKAADIAKAFREGRKPTPGAAGEQSSQPVLELSEVLPTSTRTETDETSAASTMSFGIDTNPSLKSASLTSSPHSRLSPLIKRSSPPPVLDELPPPQPFTPPRTLLGVDPHTLEPTSPGNWSTAATPGAGTVRGTPTDDSPMPSAFTGNSWPPESPTPDTRNKNRRGSQSSAGSTDSAQSSGLGGTERQRANMSPRKVHFSTDTTSIHPPSANVALFPSDAITPSFVPPHLPSTSSTHHPPVPPNLHSEIQTFQAPPPLSVPNTILPLIPPPIVSQEVELTPAVVAKAQKHCRFAISALDYEDAEQAKKELRAALTALGG